MNKKILFLIALFCMAPWLGAQTPIEKLEPLLLKMQGITAFTANVKLRVDIPFITMPEKEAQVRFAKGASMEVTSSDFALLPKRGLDLTFQELFEHPYLVVDRGEETVGGTPLSVVSVVPETDAAKFSIATLYWNPESRQIKRATISTKKDGTYDIAMRYANAAAPLPFEVIVSFEMERIRLPLTFMGKDASVDRKKMREQKIKKGKIVLLFEYLSVSH
ncbi:MAG: hypothetical protein CMC08_10080 [Flavobacteriaceae bacterium]|nr:hypothetical protein [Flavobacteriaceae bacterium]